MRNRFICICCLLSIVYCLLPTAAFTWGFFAHKKINQLAVFILPPEMITFYKLNIDYLTKHSTDADSRRNAVEEEAERHYIDIDHYARLNDPVGQVKNPFDSIPKLWKDAVKKYSEDTLKAYGMVPWYIEKMTYNLTDAFKEQNLDRILYLSADLGHYVADAHVPLHTTENYNGQFTNQHGIHAFWESRLPELFSDQWDFFTGRAKYIDKLKEYIWSIVKQSYAAKDSVLGFEAELNKSWSPDKKYTHEKNKKVYSAEYAQAYNKKLNGMVERGMRDAVFAVGSFWYTAWVNAGQPDLNRLMEKQVADSLKTEENKVNEIKLPKGHDE